MNERTRTIIFSANTSWYLWNFRAGLMRHFQGLGYVVHAVAPADEYSKRLAQEFSFTPVTRLKRKGTNPLQDIQLTTEYIRIYRAIKPTMVFHFTIKPGIYGSIACRLLRVPVVSTITGLGYLFTRKTFASFIATLLYKIALRGNKIVAFQNSDDQSAFIKNSIVAASKTILIPGSGIDMKKFNSSACAAISNTTLTFSVTARMLLDKGIREFIDAARIVHARHPDAKFLLVGPLDEGNPSAVPKAMLDFSNTPYLEYVGTTDDIIPYLCQSDVAVLPSYREGLPKGLLEAMAMELPIITTDVPGCRTLLDDGKNGFMIPARDTEALANAMIHMIELSPTERTRMGAFGRDMVAKTFDQSIIVKHYEQLLD